MPGQKFDDGTNSGIAIASYGVWGDSSAGNGAVGTSATNFGVYGESTNDAGVCGRSHKAGQDGPPGGTGGSGVLGVNDENGGVGVMGTSGGSTGGWWNVGVYGIAGHHGAGVLGSSDGVDGAGVVAIGQDVGAAAIAHGKAGIAFIASSDLGPGVWARANDYPAVSATSDSDIGVQGSNNNFARIGDRPGVRGDGIAEDGVWAISQNANGIYADGGNYAAYLRGKVFIAGPLLKPGGSFQIDHPLDPANKYLHHSFVESPDMKNIYDGIAVLDAKGQVDVELPKWFDALNSEFRYQLTPIGGSGPGLHIAKEIANNRFRIAGGTPGLKVSWQVTGVRVDAWAKAHRVQVEQDKPDEERGRYLHPELHNQPEEKAIDWALRSAARARPQLGDAARKRLETAKEMIKSERGRKTNPD